MKVDVNHPTADQLSAYENDQRAIVRLNGKLVRYCQQADTEEGYVKYCPEERAGGPCFDQVTEEYVMRYAIGTVTIEFVDKTARS